MAVAWKSPASGAGARRASSSRPLAAQAPAEESRGVLAVMGVVQLLDAFVVTPRVVGGAVGLKPIEVLLTMMAAGTLFGFVGVLLCSLFFWILVRICPFSIRKEIEEDQNISLGLIIGAAIIGIAIIISAAIRG